MTRQVAALFVKDGGPYFGLPGVFTWGPGVRPGQMADAFQKGSGGNAPPVSRCIDRHCQKRGAMTGSGDRCTGKCCQAFPLGIYSIEELQASYDGELRWTLGEMFGWSGPRAPYPMPRIAEIIDWWPWMIHLGRYHDHPTTGKPTPEGATDYFTCSKQDPSTGDCTVYDARPHFCRSYGVTCACEHDGCTWSAAKKSVAAA